MKDGSENEIGVEAEIKVVGESGRSFRVRSTHSGAETFRLCGGTLSL